MAGPTVTEVPRAVQFDELLERFFYDPDEDVGPFLELAPEVAAKAASAAEEVPEEFLAFALEGEIYAVPIAAVREIMKVPPITEVPRAEAALLGLMNVRGEMLPIYDLKPRLELAAKAAAVRGPADAPRAARVVLVKDPAGDAGVLVDRVVGVVKLQLSRLEHAPSLGVERDCVAGLGRQGGVLYILLDLEQALA